MTMLGLALMLMGQEIAPQTTLRPALDAAAKALLHAETCAGISSRAQEAYERRERRYYDLSHKVAALWGDRVDWGALVIDPPRRCLRAHREAELGRVDVALDRLERIFEQGILPMRRGLWIGALRLCRETVARVEEARDLVGDPVLRIALAPEASARFAGLTERMSSGGHGNGRIALRLNGKVLTEMGVYERMEGGSLDLPATTASEADFPSLIGPLAEPC